MAFDINQFRSSFKDFEPASPTNYEVIIGREPVIIGNQYVNLQVESSTPDSINLKKLETTARALDDMARTLIYRCESCSLPSRDLVATNAITYGAPKKMVSGSVYNNVSFSYIVSDNMREKHYFYEWQKSILNNNVREDIGGINDVGYYDSYVGDIDIKSYSKFGDGVYRTTLIDAYPISVQEVQLGWNNTNDYIRVNVVMAYRYFTEEFIPSAEGKGINSQQQKDIIQFDANRVNLNKARVGSPFLR